MKKLRGIIFAAILCALCAGQASALEYNIDAADDYLFGRPTTVETVYQTENPNVDRSKSTALIPPAFGSPTSYLPGSGEHLTPNLVPGALDGGGLVSSTVSATYPSVDGGSSQAVSQTIAFTDVTKDMYYSDGSLGTLKIPSLGVSARIVEGTDSAALGKGIGHFEGTSIWAGNVGLASHNRGASSYFGEIHTLNSGDTITLTTKLGTKTYAVVSVAKVSETDCSKLAASGTDILTLYTCVRDQRDLRWCVQAAAVS